MKTAGDLLSEAVEHDFEDLWENHRGLLWRSLYAYSGGRADIAEEALAEAFARAMQYEATIRDPLAWIYRTAIRVARQELKRSQTTLGLSELAHDEGSPVADADGLAHLMWALRQLSPNQRIAIVLHYEADLSVEEVSRLMGIQAATVKVHLHRGRAKLRKLLGNDEEDQ
jgi:RNA polymerase sigma-70 factor, ECF subfamily